MMWRSSALAMFSLLLHLRCSAFRIRHSEVELSKEPVAERQLNVEQKTVSQLQLERLTNNDLLQQCASAVVAGMKKETSFCASFERTQRAASYVKYSLEVSLGCLPDEDDYGDEDYDELEDNENAAADIVAEKVIEMSCPPSSEEQQGWPESCLKEFLYDVRTSRKSHSTSKLICLDTVEGSEEWNRFINQIVISIKKDSAIKERHESCYAKFSSVHSLQPEEQEAEWTSLATSTLRGLCQRETWSPQPEAGCSAVDADIEQCANDFIRWFHDSKQREYMNLFCKGGKKSFDGVVSGMTLVQNRILYDVKSNGIEQLRSFGVPRDCLQNRDKLVQAVGAAFKCSCGDEHGTVPLQHFSSLSQSALQLLPCVGLESETSAMQLKTQQRQVLELKARSMCNSDYPLMQITGDMGDDWRTVELITGPVSATPEILEDMHNLYKLVFDLLMYLGRNRKPIQLLKSPINKDGHANVFEEFESLWRKHAPRVFMSFNERGLKQFLGTEESILPWLASKTETGRERSEKDSPVEFIGATATGSKVDVGLQATFEVPLEYGLHWDHMKTFFLGTSWADHGEALSNSIHEIALILAEGLVKQDTELMPLLTETSHAAGILASILHFLAHFALQQANDNEMLANHTDEGIDVKILSCDVSTKNLMILNPRFSLTALFKELAAALQLEGTISLWSALQSAFGLITSKTEWSTVSRRLYEKLHRPGVASIICVKQVGLKDCKLWIGTSRKPNSYAGRDKYMQDVRRFMKRITDATYQTLKLVADGEGSWSYVRGCGHEIKPVFRKHDDRMFARFEDRGSGRIARLLDPDIERGAMVLPNENKQREWKGTNLAKVFEFKPFELASSTVLRPTIKEYGRI